MMNQDAKVLAISCIFSLTRAFYAQKLNDDFYAGIGLYGNYGLGIDFGNWAGDRLIKKSTMVAMTLSPSLAYKLSDRVSVGGLSMLTMVSSR
jgi:long-chain fatty acid transport protein